MYRTEEPCASLLKTVNSIRNHYFRDVFEVLTLHILSQWYVVKASYVTTCLCVVFLFIAKICQKRIEIILVLHWSYSQICIPIDQTLINYLAL